ncbi:MAG TPA: SDR family oxidoreductase [Xanthobacteraceae bacterium]|nr:SDR family oxidoreductase [Xanthobacteraceae bacterium]
MSALRFDGQSVFVAGGTSGINLAIADAFAAHGANVAVMSRAQQKVDAAVASLRRHGTTVAGYAADVRNYEAVTAALATARDALGEFDVLVSGAAGNFPASALDISPNGFKAVVDIDLIGAFHVLKAAHAHLKKPGAAIIMISAPQAVHARAQQSHVCAAKSGADMLMRVVALEWAADGIRVNAVIPGPIADTEGMRRLAPTLEAEASVRRAVPLGRMGRKEEVADLALFLASPMASFITGAVIPVDGGVTAVGNHYAG